MSSWKEDAIHHKYAPLPEEPRHKKKAKKKHVRSDHKHIYEKVAVDAHSSVISAKKGRRPYYYVVDRCRACGRIGGKTSTAYEVPDGMKLYDTGDWFTYVKLGELPDEYEVKR